MRVNSPNGYFDVDQEQSRLSSNSDLCFSQSTISKLPAMQETQVRFLGQEDPLEKEMATHSSILA